MWPSRTDLREGAPLYTGAAEAYVGSDEDSEEVKMPRESSEHFARRYWNWEGMLGCSFLVAIYSMRVDVKLLLLLCGCMG